MKTLVMFEAFGGRLKSEPEIMDIGMEESIRIPFQNSPLNFLSQPINPRKVMIKVATFTFVAIVNLPNWELPIRKYILTEI